MPYFMCDDMSCEMCSQLQRNINQMMFNDIQTVEADYSWDDTHSFINSL